MTAKQFVQKEMPTAKAERQKTNRGEVYYLIREARNTGYYVSGETESKAWVNAKNKLLNK